MVPVSQSAWLRLFLTAEAARLSLTPRQVRSVLAPRTRATTPETLAVAIDAPLIRPYKLLGSVEKTAPATDTQSMSPSPLEK